MSLEVFEAIKFQPKTLAMIERANEVVRSYQARGFVLTLRQLPREQFSWWAAGQLIAMVREEAQSEVPATGVVKLL